jgi:hypothetical protein
VTAEPVLTSRDGLTIRRLLVLTGGVGVGLAIGTPKPFDAGEADSWRTLITVIVMGLSLTGPLFVLADRRGRLGWGGLFWFAQGLGVWILLPPIIVDRFKSGIRLSPLLCLVYMLPLMGLWFALAALVNGQLSRRRLRLAPWRERFGVLLAVVWSPLGVWVVLEFYYNAFFK